MGFGEQVRFVEGPEGGGRGDRLGPELWVEGTAAGVRASGQKEGGRTGSGQTAQAHCRASDRGGQ